MGRPAREKNAGLLDTELDALPPELRWREWMIRVEAVIFAAPEPVTRDMLARLVGRGCSIDLLIEDIANELAARPYEMLVLASIAYHQPVTRGALSDMLGREVSRDIIGQLRRLDMIASGPRSPQPGAPYTYVTTKKFLEQFGLETLRDLPDLEALEDAGLLSREAVPNESIPVSASVAESEGDDGVADDIAVEAKE